MRGGDAPCPFLYVDVSRSLGAHRARRGGRASIRCDQLLQGCKRGEDAERRAGSANVQEGPSGGSPSEGESESESGRSKMQGMNTPLGFGIWEARSVQELPLLFL